jgi:hypothetical protein
VLNELARFWRRTRSDGPWAALGLAAEHLFSDPALRTPLARARHLHLFETDARRVQAAEAESMRASSLLLDASSVEATYPLVHEGESRFLRYAFLPACRRSRGLVVVFHGHNAFLHMGPMEAWNDYDVLAPWDTFGFKRQGSWFWGEGGDNVTERLVQALVAKYRAERPGQPWFCTGGSMGGFGALYHGIKYGCAGIYVVCPQVDLAAKIAEGGADRRTNPYAALAAENGSGVPDLLALATAQDRLPPLFLVQNQHDPINPFAAHSFRLLDVYNRKGAWYGVRVYPAIGHGGDGVQQEAEVFFSLILDKGADGRTPFSPVG